MFSFLKQTLLKPDAKALQPHLYPPAKAEPLSFSRLPKGIDNIHYDVVISPDLRRVVLKLTRIWLNNALYFETGKSQKKTEVDQLDSLREIYSHLSENAVHQSRQQRSIQVLQLFQMGITKFLLQTTHEEAGKFRQELQDKSNKKGGVELHEKLVLLAREEPIYLYSIRRKLFSHIHKLEQTKLRRVRHSLLGAYWPVPQRLILNPLLAIPSLNLDQAVMDNYHLMLTDKEGINCFEQLNRSTTHLFNEYLPGQILAPIKKESDNGDGITKDSRFDIRNRLDQGTLRGFLEVELFLKEMLQEEEYRDNLDSWLDEPNNMLILFPPDESYETQAARTRQTTIKWRGYLVWLADTIRQKLKADKMLDRVSAHKPTIQLYRSYRGKISIRMIYQYLAGIKDRKQLQRYLISHPVGTDADNVIRELTAARKKVHKRSNAERQHDISDCMLSYARLRSDLKNAYRAYEVMDQIRVLSENSDIELSKANNSLHSFVRSSEDKSAEEPSTDIINHVIIKADLRGSTRITETLVKQGLNPATHFSLNFFDPINKLLDTFGAEKVFVEGDAAIVSIFEYGDKNTEWVCVSRAGCLARKMIEVMDAQNSKNKSNGLPELEMGIGIAFSDGAPAFLYDGDHRIMISPAINRSSQLSNCSAMLRTKSMEKMVGSRGLRVLTAQEEQMEKVADDRLLRYNVNGIELDAPAFFKLQKELSLLKGGDKDARYYMGRVADKLGAIHTLVVRESPVRLWENETMGSEDQMGRRYFEVVTEADKIQTATKLLEDSTASTKIARKTRPSSSKKPK